MLRSFATHTVCAALAALALAACGDPACPAGSVSNGGRCEPAAPCAEGEVRDGSVCIDPSTSIGDGGGDGNQGDSDVRDADTDASVTESEPTACDAVDCGAHGACRVAGDTAECACEEGYAGEACDECEAGLVLDGEACVEPCEAAHAPSCGDHGSCEVEDEFTVCACEHPYTGELCTKCAEGFSLNDSGECEPDCGACGAHEYCNEALMKPSCECVAGYADEGEGCVWAGDGETGGIADRDLDDPDAWTTKLAEIEEGQLAFQSLNVEGVCTLGSVEQMIRMPVFEDAEPMVLEIEARTTCTSSQPNFCSGLLVNIGDKATRLALPGGPSPTNHKPVLCLTPADYQEQTLLRVRPAYAQDATMCSATWPTIQRMAIRPAAAGECPSEGALLGGLDSMAGWQSGGSVTVSGGKLTISSGWASTLVSVPADGALAFRFSSPSPANLVVTIDELHFYVSPTQQSSTFCFPSWTFGGVHRVGFQRLITGVEISAVSVEASESCRDAAFDSSFDAPINNGSWMSFNGGATIATGPDSRSAWRIQSASSSISTAIVVPGYGEGGLRPALAITNREAQSSVEGTLTINGAGMAGRTLTSTAFSAWDEDLICLGPQWAGQLAFLRVGGSATTTTSGSTPTYWVDQIDLVTVDEALCP